MNSFDHRMVLALCECLFLVTDYFFKAYYTKKDRNL